MTTEKKEELRLLVMQGLTLTDYDYSDVENGQIKSLGFSYKTKMGSAGFLNLGDIDVNMYIDDGDVCVDILDGLYLLEENGIEENFKDFADIKGITLKDIPQIETNFDWYDFYQDIGSYYEE